MHDSFSPVEISRIQLRINPILIKNNGAHSLWDFGRAKLYLLVIIIEDSDDGLHGAIYLDSFNKIGCNDYLDTYKTLYNQPCAANCSIPDRLFLISTVIRCKGNLQDRQMIFSSLQKDMDYQELVQNLTSVISSSASFPFIVSIVVKIFEVMKRYLGKIEHAALGTVSHYLSRKLGDLNQAGRFNLQKFTKNVNFNFELLVHKSEANNNLDDVFCTGPDYQDISNFSIKIS